MRKELRFILLRMRRLDMTHHEEGAEVHPLEDEEAVYDSP
jgi:hypothetical protein